MNHTSTQSKENSLFSVKTLGICLALIAAAVVAVSVFKISTGTIFLAGVLLACPLLHIWMMKDGGHKH